MIYSSEDKIQCGIASALQGALDLWCVDDRTKEADDSIVGEVASGRSIGRQGFLNIPKGLFYYAIVLHGRETLTIEASSSRPPNDSNFSGFPGIQVKGHLLTLRTRRCCELPELLGARTDAGR
jgi:hypothetical protein